MATTRICPLVTTSRFFQLLSIWNALYIVPFVNHSIIVFSLPAWHQNEASVCMNTQKLSEQFTFKPLINTVNDDISFCYLLSHRNANQQGPCSLSLWNSVFGFSCQNLSHIKMDVATGVTGYVPYQYPTPLLDPVNHWLWLFDPLTWPYWLTRSDLGPWQPCLWVSKKYLDYCLNHWTTMMLLLMYVDETTISIICFTWNKRD